MIELGFVVIKLMEVDSVYVIDQVGQLLGYFWRFLFLRLIALILVVVDVSIRLISILGVILWKTLGLDQNLLHQFFRRWKPVLLLVDGLAVEGVPQYFLQDVRHPVLLVHTAVVLNGEDDRVVGLLEGVFLAGLHHIFEHYLGGESVAVVDDWLSVTSVPAVN